MRSDHKQHLIYVIVVLAVAVGLIIYQNYQSEKLTDQINFLSTQLTNLKNDLKGDISTLQQKDLAQDKGLGELGVSLTEKEQQIKSLTGSLSDLKIQSEKQVSELQNTIDNLKLENQDFSQVIEDSIPAVVSIQTDVGKGSGFIVESDGYIVTNYHVIKGANAGGVLTSNGNKHQIRIVGFSEDSDIAVLKINGTNFRKLRFGDSSQAKVGQKVIAIGSPAGLDFTVTQGIISATGRKDAKGNQFIQIDVAINPGNSGGPLIDANGKVLGVATLKVKDFEGLGFALESNQVSSNVNNMISTDRSK